MKKRYSLFTPITGRVVAGWLSFALVTLGGLAGCESESVVVSDQSKQYYPLEIGSFRVYDVIDTAYRLNVPQVTRFQSKEQVDAALEPDATGQPVYRIIRSRRASATDTWKVDSIITVTASSRNVLEQRNNRRTVEMVFPVQEGKVWNLNAFNTLDSVTAANRFYQGVNQPFSITRNNQQYQYDNTVTTVNDLRSDVNQAYTTVLRTTFAKTVGPVYRVRRRFSHCDPNGGPCNPAIRYLGQSRSEVLIETGK